MGNRFCFGGARATGAAILALTLCGAARADKPLCGKQQQGPCPSVLTITGIDPLFITVSSGITVQFSLKNNFNQPTSGQVLGDVDGQRLVPEVSADINALQPGGVAQGKLSSDGPVTKGPHTIT